MKIILNEQQYQTIKKYILNEETDRQYNAWVKYDEVRYEALVNFVNYILKYKDVHQDWRIAPFARINKIWSDYSKFGFVRDEKGIEMLVDMFVYNVALLEISTIIAGHSYESPESLLRDEMELTPKQIKLIDKITDDVWGDWDKFLVSDYGLKPLMELSHKLLAEDNTAEEKILTLDRMLNIIHARSDLSKIFVEGGSGSLDKLFSGE